MRQRVHLRRPSRTGAALGAVTVLFACASAPPAAQPKDPTVAVQQTQVQSLGDIALAVQLAEYGERTRSPVALVSAAQILLATPTQPLTDQPTSMAADVQGTAGTRPEQTRPRVSAAALLSRAGELAAGNESLMATIRQLQTRAQGGLRGAVGGPREAYYRVSAYTTNIHTISFRGDELAAVYIAGDGTTDLDLYVFDQNGNLIVYDDGYTDEAYVEWYPRWTGEFRIEVRNLGRVWNEYYFATN